MTIVLYGGSFDPVHLGHIKVSLSAGAQLKAKEIILIPAKKSPLKAHSPVAQDNDRLKMAELATKDYDKLTVSDFELRQKKQKFTIETVRHFKSILPDDTNLCWLIGADSIKEIDHWYKIEELIDECRLCTMYRGGVEKPDYTKFIHKWGKKRVARMQNNILRTPQIDISSTEIREKIYLGQDVTEMLDPKVYQFIKDNRLYK